MISRLFFLGLQIFQRTPIPLHIKFDEIRENIISSRFMFQTIDIKDTVEEVEMIKNIRSLAEKNKDNFNITFYHPFFQYIGK